MSNNIFKKPNKESFVVKTQMVEGVAKCFSFL